MTQATYKAIKGCVMPATRQVEGSCSVSNSLSAFYIVHLRRNKYDRHNNNEHYVMGINTWVSIMTYFSLSQNNCIRIIECYFKLKA